MISLSTYQGGFMLNICKSRTWMVFLLLCIASIGHSDEAEQDTNLPKLSSSLISVYTFEGDSHGDFQGDLAVLLSDGSAWKVHPDDRDKISNWNIGDSMHISLRTSF